MPGHKSQGSFFVNIGIPQGSTLSPILFLFFTESLLLRLGRSRPRWPSSEIAITSLAYVDDTYLLVSSSGFRKNCDILKELHDIIMDWANERGVTFEPTKYAVMHFTPRSSYRPAIVPQIKGLKQDSLKTELRILGIIVDANLRRHVHVEHVSLRT